MLLEELSTYESWNLDPPLLPERSKLYHLEPIAIGTAYLEGLVSYICRLAEGHCVSPGVLLQQEILPSLRKRYTVGPREIHEIRESNGTVSVSSFPKPASSKNPNEQGFEAWQYVEGLQPLTLRSNLQSLTIPRWVDQIAKMDRSIQVARELRAWCPECFKESRSTNQVTYEPLLWAIAAVTVCPQHHQPLQSRCPHCHRTQRPITGKMQVGHCSQCSGWLDIRTDADLAIEETINAELRWHLSVVEGLMEVLGTGIHSLSSGTQESLKPMLHNIQKEMESDLTNRSIKHAQWHLLKIFAH